MIKKSSDIRNYKTFAFATSSLMVKSYVKIKSTDSPPAFSNWEEAPIVNPMSIPLKINPMSIGIVFLF